MRKGIAAERNPQGHASCYANLADILSGGIGWSLPKEMTNFERHIGCIFLEIYRAEPRCETTFITLRR